MSREWVLLRGLTRDQAHWGAFKTKLSEADPEALVTCVDLPGAGEYHNLSAPASIRATAEFVYSHLKEPKPKQRIIVAISLGGMIATELTELHPKSADGMILINSSFGNFSPIHHRLTVEALKHIFKAGIAKTPFERERAVLNMVSNRGENKELIDEWTRISQERPVSVANFVKQLFAAAMYCAPKQKLEPEICLLSSEKDRMVNARCSQRIANRWNVPIHIHPSAGHELSIDDSDWVVEQCLNFINRI